MDDNNGRTVSVCIPAHNARDTLARTMKSIEGQSCMPDEIMIGVDHCASTLSTLSRSVPDSLRDITRTVWMTEHAGCYRTLNTLITLSSGRIISIFNADDEMMPDHLELMTGPVRERRAVIRALAYNTDGRSFPVPCCGIIAMRRPDFLGLRGYEPWPCGADSEFLIRASAYMPVEVLDKPVMYRHILETSLTHNPVTGINTPVRKRLRSITRERRERLENGRGPVLLDGLSLSPSVEFDYRDMPDEASPEDLPSGDFLTADYPSVPVSPAAETTVRWERRGNGTGAVHNPRTDGIPDRSGKHYDKKDRPRPTFRHHNYKDPGGISDLLKGRNVVR